MEEENIPYSETVRKALPSLAKSYHSYFSEYQYLVVSSNFKNKKYYIISGKDANFLHLTGLGTKMDAYDFYLSCRRGKIKTSDFSIKYINKDRNKVTKSTIKAKITIFPNLFGTFSRKLYAEGDFSKGSIACSLAISDGTYTLGLVDKNVARPMTLLKGDELNKDKKCTLDLIMVKSKGEKKYHVIIYGDKSEVKKYLPIIGDLLSEEFIKSF